MTKKGWYQALELLRDLNRAVAADIASHIEETQKQSAALDRTPSEEVE